MTRRPNRKKYPHTVRLLHEAKLTFSTSEIAEIIGTQDRAVYRYMSGINAITYDRAITLIGAIALAAKTQDRSAANDPVK